MGNFGKHRYYRNVRWQKRVTTIKNTRGSWLMASELLKSSSIYHLDIFTGSRIPLLSKIKNDLGRGLRGPDPTYNLARKTIRKIIKQNSEPKVK